MKRREFLKTTAATSALATLGGASLSVSAHSGTNETQDVACCDRTHATVQDAMKAPAETIAYVPAIYAGTGIQKPDYLATIDVDPKSADYGKVISRLEMPNVGGRASSFWMECLQQLSWKRRCWASVHCAAWNCLWPNSYRRYQGSTAAKIT